MKRYLSREAKKALVEKVLHRQAGESVRAIAQQNNIGLTTLRSYIKLCQEGKLEKESAPVAAEQLTPAERFEHVLATSKLDPAALGAYCREPGLYSFQLQEWKEAYMGVHKSESKGEHEQELKALRAENKALKSDLHRKDKALAEASALLILKKKQPLFGGSQRTIALHRRADRSHNAYRRSAGKWSAKIESLRASGGIIAYRRTLGKGRRAGG